MHIPRSPLPPHWTSAPSIERRIAAITTPASPNERYRILQQGAGCFRVQVWNAATDSWNAIPDGTRDNLEQAELAARYYHQQRYPKVVKTLELPR